MWVVTCLLDDLLEVERVDADDRVQHVGAADELGEHTDAVGAEVRLREDVLEREEVEPVAHRRVEQHVRDREERQTVVHRPLPLGELGTDLPVVHRRISKLSLDPRHHLADLAAHLRRLVG